MYRCDRKTIGVFVTQVNQEYQDALSRGICDRAKQLGYNVAFFSNYLGYGEYQYERGERQIADLPSYKSLDGIIIAPDAMFVRGFEESIRSNIDKYSTCPIVSVRQKIDQYYNVLIDEDFVLDEMINHFINQHGYKKINFLTGPKDSPISMERLEAFKRVIKKYGIPYEEDRIYYGNFYKSAGYQAVERWISDPDKIPEAIICANDFMAFTVCKALEELGIMVPKDIAVSGYDDMTLSEDYSPSITSAGMPIYEMGMEAVDKIDKHNNGIEQEQITYLKTVITYRESCGCMREQNEQVSKKRNRLINELEAKEKAISNNAFMSIELTGVKLIDELDQKLAAYVYMNEGFSSFYMCLYKDWDSFDVNNSPELWQKSDVIMEVGIRNGEWMQKTAFDRTHLIPPVHEDKGPQIFFFNMLHYQEKCFGYTAISFYEPQAYKLTYQGWLINVCNALENIRINTELNRLVYKLEDMYIKDELTGLYNRRGLELLGKKYLQQSIDQQSKLMAFTADMDKLKYINDNYGHAGGDVAIKAVADALLYAAEDDEICMRVGGDEFTVIGLEYDEMKLAHFVSKFHEEIDRFNREEGYIFKVFVSYGCNLIIPDKNTTIEDCLVIADTKMYQQKYDKETKRSAN